MARALLVGILLIVACAPASALAATRTVATRGGFDLRARENGDRICLTLRRHKHYQGQECGRIPRSPHRPLSVFPDVPTSTYAAAVPASVRFAETESRTGSRKRHRTFAARGFSARFVLIPAPLSAVFVRFYGADGTLLGIDGGPVGYIDLGANLTPVFGSHDEGVEAHTEARIAPTPEQADRVRTLACVDVVNRTGGSGVCDKDSENAVVVMGSCDTPDLVGGIVAAGVAGVRLTLGSGAELTLGTLELPAGFGGRRAIGATVPSGEAVRDATAIDAAGLAVARVVVGTSPGGQPCAAGSGERDDRFSGPLTPVAPPAGAVAVASAGGVALLVADQGETLCVGVGTLVAGTCPAAPADSDEPRLLRLGGTVAGALSRDAARVTLSFDRGRDLTVRTTDGAAYTGRWAGDVRFFAAQVPAGREVTRAVVRNAAGTVIGISPRGIPRPKVRRTALAERGGQALQLVLEEGRQPCITAFAPDLPIAPTFCVDPHPGTPIDGPVLRYRAVVSVSCSPRQAIAYGPLADGLPAPEIVLAGNQIVRARTLSARGEHAWVAFLPDAPVTGLRAGKLRASLPLPPPSQQCGYNARRSF